MDDSSIPCQCHHDIPLTQGRQQRICITIKGSPSLSMVQDGSARWKNFSFCQAYAAWHISISGFVLEFHEMMTRTIVMSRNPPKDLSDLTDLSEMPSVKNWTEISSLVICYIIDPEKLFKCLSDQFSKNRDSKLDMHFIASSVIWTRSILSSAFNYNNINKTILYFKVMQKNLWKHWNCTQMFDMILSKFGNSKMHNLSIFLMRRHIMFPCTHSSRMRFRRRLEFSLNGAELSLNSGNSENLRNHWGMNWVQCKDSLCLLHRRSWVPTL